MEEQSERRRILRRRSGSLFFPILLITAGIIFLLNNLGMISGDLWSNLAMFWPVILIAIGLDTIYRGEGLVGAAFMIGLGFVFLLANLGILTVDIWQLVLRLWPLLLVAIGFDILIGRRSWIASLIGLVVILALLAGALWLYGVRVDRGQALPGETVSQALDGALQASVRLEPAAGSLHVDALPGPGDLVNGTVSTRSGRVSHDFSMEGDRANYALRSRGTTIITAADSRPYTWDLGLTDAVPLDLRVSMGAGQADLDLTGLQISSLNVSVAVGQANVVLPAEGRYDAVVEGAIGQLIVSVPAGVGVRLEADTALTSLVVPQEFTKDGDVYRSPEADSAEHLVNLKLNQAIGSVIIDRR
jgi:hypothetical protein